MIFIEDSIKNNNLIKILKISNMKMIIIIFTLCFVISSVSSACNPDSSTTRTNTLAGRVAEVNTSICINCNLGMFCPEKVGLCTNGDCGFI